LVVLRREQRAKRMQVVLHINSRSSWIEYPITTTAAWILVYRSGGATTPLPTKFSRLKCAHGIIELVSFRLILSAVQAKPASTAIV
jgi:hypothetical protein